MLHDEGSESSYQRRVQIGDWVFRQWDGIDRLHQQLEGVRREAAHERLLRPEDAVHGSGRGAHSLRDASDRKRGDTVAGDEHFCRADQRRSSLLAVHAPPAHGLTA